MISHQQYDKANYARLLGWRYIMTATYFWLLYFFSIVQLRLWLFVASLNAYLLYSTNENEDTGKFIELSNQIRQQRRHS